MEIRYKIGDRVRMTTDPDFVGTVTKLSSDRLEVTWDYGETGEAIPAWAETMLEPVRDFETALEEICNET